MSVYWGALKSCGMRVLGSVRYWTVRSVLGLENRGQPHVNAFNSSLRWLYWNT